MNLTLASVLSCSDSGCRVQPLEANQPFETNYSQKIVQYDIPILSNQLVIVNTEPSPPETIFRFRRSTITRVDGEQIEVDDNGDRLIARKSGALQEELSPGMDVILKGHNDEDRCIIDIVVDGKPAHATRIADEWFPLMRQFV